MAREFDFTLQPDIDPSLLPRVDEMFDGESLLQMILHAHLLIERGLASEVEKKLVRPDVLKKGRWTFHQKLELYVGLYDPSKDTELMLRGFNKLRNAIAHDFQDLELCVKESLPWEAVAESPRPETRSLVRAVAMALLFDVGVVRSTNSKNFEATQNLKEKR